MKKPKIIAALVGAVLLAFGVNLDKLGIDIEALLSGQQQVGSEPSASSGTEADRSAAAPRAGEQWSDSDPAVNLWHVFEGEINRRGKPVGFHSRPGGRDPAGARVVLVKDGPNRNRVYSADVEIRDGDRWQRKFSTFFPDSMNDSDVLEAILNAYRNSKNPGKQPWQGPSGHGFNIQGYTLSGGDINTAFPVYVRD